MFTSTWMGANQDVLQPFQNADDSDHDSEDIAEEIVWVASRPDHVQVAQVRESPLVIFTKPTRGKN